MLFEVPNWAILTCWCHDRFPSTLPTDLGRRRGDCGCVDCDRQRISGLYVNAGRHRVTDGLLLRGTGIGHVDPGRRRTGDVPSVHPVAKRECLPEYSRLCLLSASSCCPGTQRTACRRKPARSGPQCGRDMARLRQRLQAILRPDPADNQLAAKIPPLSTQFPASDLSSRWHRGHRSSCVWRPYSAPCGPECRRASGFDQS